MKLPGEAILEFKLIPIPDKPGWTSLHQTASFLPKGLMGLAYWYAVLPLHGIVFRGMLHGIRRAAEAGAASPGSRDGGSVRIPPTGTDG
jgi:hypothetical protein